MTRKSGVAIAAIAATAIGGGVADAATGKAHRRHAARSSQSATAGNAAETELTGDTATKAKAAALEAVPGGTVRRAATEDSGDASGAAFEVHVTKSDGSEVEVLEDSSFNVLSVTARRGHHHGGHDGGGNPNETELTGNAATQAKAAALAAVPGGTVRRASTEDPGDASGAAYELHVTKSDGSEVEVLEDSSFNVLSVNASTHRHGPRGG